MKDGIKLSCLMDQEVDDDWIRDYHHTRKRNHMNWEDRTKNGGKTEDNKTVSNRKE
jgi:hypothetical protein